jgi:hypothetical protein
MKKSEIFEIIAIVLVLIFCALYGCEGTEPEPLPPEPEPTPAPDCVVASDCHVLDTCETATCVDGDCRYEQDDSKCPEGYFCKAIIGCYPEYDEPEPNCETDDDCPSFDCTVGECRNGFCFSELHDEFCFPDWKCTTLGCVRDPDYYDNRCYGDDECNDGINCTRDTCSMANHTCANVPMDSRCPDDLVCNAMTGCTEVF